MNRFAIDFFFLLCLEKCFNQVLILWGGNFLRVLALYRNNILSR